MKVRREWILKNWVELLGHGLTRDELMMLYWRDVEGFEFHKSGKAMGATRERARQLYARAKTKLKKIGPRRI
jgi:Sigma-70, region 4